MDIVDKILAASLTFMGILFSLFIASALSETFAHVHVTLFGSRLYVFWAILSIAIGGAVFRWRQLGKRSLSVKGMSASVETRSLEGQQRRVTSGENMSVDTTLTPSLAGSRAMPSAYRDADGADPDAIDMATALGVAKVRSHRDPVLWHQATMAALAYRGDQHGFLRWVLQQPETDRATAGWIFLWAEGSRYLRGETYFPLNHLTSHEVSDLLDAVCKRSEGMGFSNDALGLDTDFEAERLKCLAVLENGELAPGIVAPAALLSRPFAPPCRHERFTLDDGLIICAQQFWQNEAHAAV